MCPEILAVPASYKTPTTVDKRDIRPAQILNMASMFDLLPTQIGHVEKLQTILEDNSFALDFSSLGSGKTYTGSHIALQLGFQNVVVICPVLVQSKWKEMQERYNVPVQENLSFCGVRSVKNKQPKHGLLNRQDYTVEIDQDSSKRYMDKTDFTPTPKLLQMIDVGLLLIIDEMQHLKNVTSNSQLAKL